MKWAARISRDAIASLDPLRLSAGIEMGEHDGELWLRGSGEMPRSVPWECSYELHEGGVLREPGHHLSVGKLPATKWSALPDGLRIAQPPLLREGFPPVPLTITLAPRAEWIEPAMIELSMDSWRSFAETASAIRLGALRFAATEDGRVFVRGTPLPAVQGTRYVERDGIVVPAGFTWAPQATSSTLSAALRLGKGELAVFLREGGCLRIPARAWQTAARAAIRGYAS